MFSVLAFTFIAISAIASIASGANLSATRSVFRSSTYCVIRAFWGSVRMRTKSSRVRGSSSTRIGNRPCSSGMRSAGLATWKAPAAMNRIWSVRTIPYFVCTAEPSTIGSRSRWTPSPETSGPAAPPPPRDLVQLVEEHDAGVLGAPDGLGDHLVYVDQLLCLLLRQEAPRLRHAPPPPPGPRRQDVPEHVAAVEAHLLQALAREHLDHRRRLLLRLELHGPLVEPARAELRAELLLGRLPRRVGRDLLERAARERLLRAARQQELEQALLGELLGLLLDPRGHLGLDHGHRELGEVPDHRLDVAPDVADLGVLGGLDLQEGRLGELREPPRDLGLPDARRPDHDDVLRRHLVAQLGGQVLPPPAVAERHGHRPLRPLLSPAVPVELGDDLDRREREAVGAHSTSTVTCSFV